MNTNNPFGSPQGGAFQSFGQQPPAAQRPTGGFFQAAGFRQTSGMNQASSIGNTAFRQPPPAFGQSSVFGPPSSQTSQPVKGQAPAFGQVSSGFGLSAKPTFGQIGGQSQTLAFGQAPTFGQSSSFGQASAFGQPTGFGLSAGNSQAGSSSGTPPALRPPQIGFGQPQFGQPLSTSVSSTTFSSGQGVGQSRGFPPQEFSFKPANEVTFKPIFSASPEPSNPQVTTTSSSPFGSSTVQTTSSSNSTTSGFALLAGTRPAPAGFSFSQPASAPSISAQKNPLTAGSSNEPAASLQFTFSQPAALSSSKTSTTQPTTPSSFSFSAKSIPPQSANVFGKSLFGQTSGLGDGKDKVQQEEKGNGFNEAEGSNPFALLRKPAKRKQDVGTTSAGPEKAAGDEEVSAGGDAPRQPTKRHVTRPQGLFGRALNQVLKSNNPAKREAVKEGHQPAPEWGDVESKDVKAQDNFVNTTPPRAQAPIREVLEKAEEADPAATSEAKIETTPSPRRDVRTKSTDSLSGMSPSDCTVIQCKNVPPHLNKKDVIRRHFSLFGNVIKVLCRPQNNLAIVHFDDHASAAKAKKRGKHLQGTELLILWQRKKQSDKGKRSTGEKEEAEEEEGGRSASSTSGTSILRLPTFRSPGISTVTLSHSPPVKNLPLAKSQFDSEPQQEGGTDTQSVERSVPSSLLHLVGQVAETAEDKYRLLEQRDKVLRQDRPKRTDLDLSRVFVGTCPDMCPEKERYMRETRKQLSSFEVIPDTEMVDHTTAIKEYSRSSADQEEPLPHELRPLPVLSMTMDYLVTQVMDQGHDNYRDWYDFVWNRTRSIRKDITQQRLCCPETVSLIEKCTRFHVHCAHHLCEEPMMSFDAKINNENMTKCLQSLKEMYQDLALCNVYCSMEAEFRQYNVLLKLNDGDILREVQQFRDEVRNSPEVKFAVQAFAALNNNNFVRFFKLVKAASYLSSCLLHRYFNQVRDKALKTLSIAHTVGSHRSTAFPLQDMVRMLMFRDADEASDFVRQYGLTINAGMVELSRANIQEPQLPLPQKKSDVILAKKTALTGVVVNGGFVPKPPRHTPVCSFDSQNRYRGESPQVEPTPSFFKPAAFTPKVEVTAPAQVLPQIKPVEQADTAETGETSGPPPGLAALADTQQLFQPIAPPQPIKPLVPPPKPQPVYTDQDILAELDTVVDEVVNVAVSEITAAGESYVKTALAESSAQMEALTKEVVEQMLREMSSTEIQVERERVAENRRIEEARRKQEREAFLTEFSFTLCKEVMHEVIDESIKETAAAEFQEAVDEKAECVARCTEQLCLHLIEETLEAKIKMLAEEILEHELHRIRKYITRWRDVVAVRRQLRRQMRSFPAAPCCVDPRFKLKALAPSAPTPISIEDLACGWVNLGNSGTLAISSNRLLKMRSEVAHQLRVHYYYQQLLEESVWVPLDLPALVTEHISDPPDRIFWKAMLLLPSDDESVASVADRILSDWLEVKFGGDPESDVKVADGTLRTLCVTNTLQEREQGTHKVHVSIKVSRGPLIDDSLSKADECCELQGTGALILLLPALFTVHPGSDRQDVPLLSALVQLKQLQQVSAWNCQLPLVILVPGSDDGNTHKLEEALKLHTLVTEGLISEYTFFFIPETISDLQGCKQLTSALGWLLARAPQNAQLSCQPLVQLIEASLSREFSSRVYALRQERLAAGLPPQQPAPIVSLYNAIVAHLADTVASPDLSSLSWPPQEFCMPDTCTFVPHLGWNSVEHLAWLHKTILSLQLPPWKLQQATESWPELSSAMFDYAAQIPVSHLSHVLLMSRLENLLERVRLQHQPAKIHRNQAIPTSLEQETHTAPNQVPWDDFLVLCIDHKLKDAKIPGSAVCEDAMTEDGDILVYVPYTSMKEFGPPEEWNQAIRETHKEKHKETEGAPGPVPPSSQSIIKRLFHNLESLRAQESVLDITEAQEEVPVAHQVLQSIEREKAESQRCMDQFQHWLDTDPLDYLSTPRFLPSSTLLSMPTPMMSTTLAQTQDGPHSQEPETEEVARKARKATSSTLSMSQRLRELHQQILASQEEQTADGLKLNSLLSIIDD